MNNDFTKFVSNAKTFVKNPLGIIALFIVLIYGFATQIALFANSFTEFDMHVFAWFLVIFPLIVLGSFLYLVCKHPDKLYGPSDFREEANYIRTLIKPDKLKAQPKDVLPEDEPELNATHNYISTSKDAEVEKIESDGWEFTKKGFAETNPTKKSEYFQQAEHKYRECTKLVLNNPSTWHGLGVAQLNLDKIEEANEAFNRAYSLKDDNVPILFNLGLSYHLLHSYKLAKKFYLKALKLAPGNRSIKINLVKLYIDLKDFALARDEAKQLIEENNKDVNAHYLLGLVNVELNNYSEALSSFYTIQSIDRTFPEINKWIDVALEKQYKRNIQAHGSTGPFSSSGFSREF